VTRRFVLDAGPLGELSHPRSNLPITDWLKRHLSAGVQVYVPDIADYEVRRELLRAGKTRGLRRLDSLERWLTYLPIDSSSLRLAAELWAEARRKGAPSADPRELDCDVILAAQAQPVAAIVITENTGHLDLFVEARRWQDVTAP